MITLAFSLFFLCWNGVVAQQTVPRFVHFLRGGRHCKDLAVALARCLIPHVPIGIILPVMMGGLLGSVIAIVIPYAFAFRRAWRAHDLSSSVSSSDAVDPAAGVVAGNVVSVAAEGGAAGGAAAGGAAAGGAEVGVAACEITVTQSIDAGGIGTYECHKYDGTNNKNDWHYVTIKAEGSQLRWSNRAGVSWMLTQRADGNLDVGKECPYYKNGHTVCQVVRNSAGSVTSLLGPWGEPYDAA